jgi:hypothetical protein
MRAFRGTPHIGLVFSENFLTCTFLGAGLGVMNQFRGLHAHPLLHRLIASDGNTLRTLYKTPVTSHEELKLKIFAAFETVTLQMLENTRIGN